MSANTHTSSWLIVWYQHDIYPLYIFVIFHIVSNIVVFNVVRTFKLFIFLLEVVFCLTPLYTLNMDLILFSADFNEYRMSRANNQAYLHFA